MASGEKDIHAESGYSRVISLWTLTRLADGFGHESRPIGSEPFAIDGFFANSPQGRKSDSCKWESRLTILVPPFFKSKIKRNWKLDTLLKL